MPKVIKGNPNRKPPEPTAHEDIKAWFKDVSPRIAPVISVLDELIRDELDGLQYGVKFHRAFYGRPDLGWIIEVAPYQKTFNVLFPSGADFDDPPPLGSTGKVRYVKLADVDDVMAPELREWIAQAGRRPGWS